MRVRVRVRASVSVSVRVRVRVTNPSPDPDQAAQEVVDGTPAVTTALGALGANLDCAWLKPAYRAPLEA